MMTADERSFLDEIADLDHPADRALLLARALGEIVRYGSQDSDNRRHAVDALFIEIERHAGLRL